MTTLDLMKDSLGPARIRRLRTGAANGGWANDRYPQLETLDAGATITIADLDGPGVIRSLHFTQHPAEYIKGLPSDVSREQAHAMISRGVVLEIEFEHSGRPSVLVPLADFFADGCSGRASHFTTPYIEKAPESYNCFIPMPFEQHATVRLRNETPWDLWNYSFVEWEELEDWEPELGRFHATWRRFGFQLNGESDELFCKIEGDGHFVGQSWSVATDERAFGEFKHVMEGNQEIRIDGATEPQHEYLGTEDSFGLSWGFQKEFNGLRNGINFVRPSWPALLSVYRLRFDEPIRFTEQLEMRTNWQYEYSGRIKRMLPLKEGRGWVDYATTFYWYQREPGYDHEPMASLDVRARPVLNQNENPSASGVEQPPVW
ncbi:DUF2961 domain-containing protein [Kribbella sp. NPDC050820]|uniref:DUF2961 domain-containing protein n=1 Tax=Kribbella sp. NPDC050820 TaxID=3155408 RepID=UPI0033C28D8B